MPRKNIIRLSGGNPAAAIGIVSQEKFWKLAWQINEALGVKLALNEASSALDEAAPFYIFKDKNTQTDFFLLETRQERRTPKIAREYGFWLFIRSNRSEEAPDIKPLIQKLKTIDNMNLAGDLTGIIDLYDWIP